MAGLLFASKTHGGKLDFVPARRIAKLVQQHDIRLVVSNGCRSASTHVHDVEANLATVMLEEGITNVLAMQTEFMSGAAKLFIIQFYRSFLQQGVSFSRAVRDAREHLQHNPVRSARFGLEVPLQDWIVPVAYLTDVDLEIAPPKVCQNIPPPLSERAVEPDSEFDGPDLVGRDSDALRIERDLTESQVLILYGQAGVGKTALLRQMVDVWRATSFVERVFYVDFAQSPTPVTMHRFVDRINGNEAPEIGIVEKVGEAVLGWWNKEKPKPPRNIPAEVAQLIQNCHDHSTIFVLDSLDAALSSLPQFSRLGSLAKETRQELYQFVESLINFTPAKGQKRPLLVLIGRGDEAWWNERFQQVPARFINLKPLDLPSAVILGTRILEQAGVDSSSWDVGEKNSLHQIVNLFGRLPLALEVMLPNARNMDLSEFYQNTHLHMIPETDVMWKHKPSTPGSDRLLHDLYRRLNCASFQMRNVLRSLALFWLEGPAVIGILAAWHELDPGMPKVIGKDFGSILNIFRDVGGWELNVDTQCITEVHPLMTILLRSMLRSYLPFETRLKVDQFFKACRIMVDQTQNQLMMLNFTGKYDFALICRIQKRSLVNIVAIMQDFANEGASLEAEDWPRDSLVYFFSTSRFAFRDSVPDHRYLLSYLEPTLKRYVATFGGPKQSLATKDLLFALQISNHLAIMYLAEFQVALKEASGHVDFSIELIKASEREHTPLSIPTEIHAKQIAFRLKAFICLFQRNFDDAQAYWDKQSELEIVTLGVAQSVGGQQDGSNALGQSWIEGIANLGLSDSAGRVQVGDVIKEVFTKYLPALAQLRQSAWSHMVKAIKEEDGSTLEGEIRPYARAFMEQAFGLSTPAMSRVLDVSKETSYDVGYLLEEHDYSSVDQLTQELETGLDRADAGRIVRAEYKLLREALEQGNWAGAQVHIRLLLRHLPALPGVSPQLLMGLSILEESLEFELGRGVEGNELTMLINAVKILMANEEAAVVANLTSS